MSFNKEKPNLLLLHGALGSRAQFRKLKPLLADHFNLYDFNFEGHGGRLTEYPYSIELFANNTQTFIEENQLNDVHIFGYSMGGYVALRLASTTPEMVQSIITLGTKFDWTEDSAARETKMLNPAKIQEKIPHFAERLKLVHAPLDWKRVMAETADMMERMGAGERLETAHLAKIDIRVVIGLGGLDRMVSQEESIWAVQSLMNAEFVELPETPHPIEQVDPVLLARFIYESINQ